MSKLELLEQLSGYGILAYDLRLFLDVNPTHQQALADFKKITTEYSRLLTTYEQKYGALTSGRDVAGTWTHNPWPWHTDFGGGT